MTKTHKNRLLKLADVIEVVPRKMYDQNCYSLDPTIPRCAASYAVTVPAFKRAGLKPLCAGWLLAAGAFFGLDAGDRNYVFGLTCENAVFGFERACNNRTPKQEAKLIRDLVKRHEREDS